MDNMHLLLVQIYCDILPDIRSKAKELGWAIGVHGSLTRDFDLIAVRWADDTCDIPKLLSSIFDILDLNIIERNSVLLDCESRDNRRECYAIPIGAGAYIDLSIIDS